MQASALLTGRAMKLIAAIGALSVSLTALADVANLDSGLPIEIEDARPIERGEKALQLITRWERQRSGANLFVVEPQFQWGFAARSQVALTLHTLGGTADSTGNGDLRLQLMRQLHEETTLLPAFAAFLRLDVPTGHDSRGLDTTVRLAATKTLGAEPDTHQLHVNVVWTRNAAPGVDERTQVRRLLVGYSTLLGERTALVGDLIREEERSRGALGTIVELGLRRELSRETTLSLGVGTGRGSPEVSRWRLMAGLERSF